MREFVKDPKASIRFALIISSDNNNNIKLRRYAVERLYRNLSVTSKYLNDNNVTSTLENIVSDSCKNQDHWKVFQMKQYAFSCLEKVADNRSDNFYQNYYLYLKERLKFHVPVPFQENNFKTYYNRFFKAWNAVSTEIELLFVNPSTRSFESEKLKDMNESISELEISGIKKLDVYLNTSNKREKYRILKTLSICMSDSSYKLDLSIFDIFPSDEWGKELLMYTLLLNNDTWNVTQTSQLVREIHKLDSFLDKHNQLYCIEDVLEVLINNQNACEFDIGFLVKLVMLLRCNEALDVVFQDLCSLPAVFPRLELLRLKQKCNDNQIIYTDETEIQTLLYLLVYSDEVIDSTLSKVKPGTSITELINFFDVVMNKDLNQKEDFLRALTPNGTIEDWKEQLSLSLIETFIYQEFPAWDYKTAVNISADNAIVIDRKYFSPNHVNDSENCRTYRQFNDLEKRALNTAMSSDTNRLILNKLFYDLNRILMKLVSKCKFSIKILDQVKILILSIDNENKIVQLINALELFNEYDINISDSDAIEIIFSSTETNVQKNVHEFILQKFLPGTYEKPVNQLVAELCAINIKENISLLNSSCHLMKEYNEVINAYNQTSDSFEDSELIKNWNTATVQQWAERFRTKRSGKENFESSMVNIAINQYEKIAVIKRAMELTSGLILRDIQLLSVILLLNNKKNTGRLAQVNTGEGKTVTIAMLAAYHALEGSKVDIITSSELLAIPQAEQLKKFYNILHLKVSHNFYQYSSYESDIVYGTSNEFQADILRDEFRQSNARRGRKFDVTIVDEVDNMLVDGNNHIVLLSCDMPAMDHLESLLATIYVQVQAAAESVIVKDGQCFFIDRENAFDENGQVKNEIIENHVPIAGTAQDFIIHSTKQHVKNLIRDCDTSTLSPDFPEIKIPKHLRELICKSQLDIWIKQAVAAKFYYTNKEDYIIIRDKIKIVDAANTGVIQANMHWSDGLHQFIEIKHGAKVTPESLTTNFISNVSFFRRYRPKIFGFSGTLGCQGTRKLLNETYDVDTVIIPPFKLKQHKELVPILINNRQDWYKEIVKSCLRKLSNGRAVLIIMEYIRETEEVEKLFIEYFCYDKSKIKLYKTNDDSSVIEKPLEAGNVIITTNICGRGADIKLTKEVDRNGGLHVCITFLPKNSRVEQQNIGRTSRIGNRGTSQFLIWSSENDIVKLQKQRYEKEKLVLSNAEKEITRVTTKDEIFQKFCQLTNEIKYRNEITKPTERMAVEERFAIWLKIHDVEITNEPKSHILKMFETFRDKILKDDRNGKLIKNPYMHVTIGNIYLKKEKYQDAISEYTCAIELDPHFVEHAHYNRGYAYLAEYGGNVSNNRYYIDKAVDDFKRARELIKEREYSLHLMQTASNGEVFSQQISNKLNLYNIQNSAIELAVGPDIEAINQDIKDLKKKLEVNDLSSEIKDEISEKINNLVIKKKRVGVIESAMVKNHGMKIEIHDMKQCLPEDDHSHDAEIKEFERNGAIGSFYISEIPPIKWVSVIGLLVLGLSQLVVGVALTVFTIGAGASFGTGLIAEGINDIITAVKDGIINRDFSWARWALEKAISWTVSIVCAGWKAMKDVGKTLYAGAKNAVSIGSKTVTAIVKEGWKIVAKRVGFELSKGLAKNVITELANYGINETLIPLIQEKIIEVVQVPIVETLQNNSFVKMMLKLDEKNSNHYYENRLKTMGMELLHSKSSSKNKFNPLNQLNSSSTTYKFLDVAEKIGSRIADNKIPGLSAIRQVSDALEAVNELSTLTNCFIKDLTEAIEKEAKKAQLEQKLANEETTVDEQSKKQESTSKNSFDKIESDIDLSRLREEDEQVKLTTAHGDATSISKGFVTVISTNIVHGIQQKLIAPVVQMGVNCSVDAITSNLAKTLNKDVELYRSHKRVIHYQNKGFSDTNIETKKQRTDAEAKQRIQKVDELIDDICFGRPVGLPHLGAASDAIDRPIEVYSKDGELKYIIGDTKKGKPVKVQYHEGNIGHYTLMTNKEPFIQSTDQNMCLFNVLAAQTGDNPHELKQSCLNIMSSNKDYMAKQVNDITRLEMYSKLRLDLGGATYTGNYPNDAKKILDNSTDRKGYKYDAKGHPHNHVPFRGTNGQKLEAVSTVLKKKIEIYDKDGTLKFVIGKNFKGNPIKLDHHETPGNMSDEWFTSRGGKEKYRMEQPGDTTFYDIISNQAKCQANKLESDVSDIINRIPLSKAPKYCVEKESTYCKPNKNGDRIKDGFVSEAEMNFVAHYALKTKQAQQAMKDLNDVMRKKGKNVAPKDVRKVLYISETDMGLPRRAYGRTWQDGKKIGTIQPIQTVVLLLQHHDGKENDPNADVHVHTFYPKLQQ